MDGEPVSHPALPTRPRRHGIRRTTLAKFFLSLVAAVAVTVLTLAVLRARNREQPVLALLESMAGTDPAQRLEARQRLVANPATAAPILVAVVRRGKTRWQTQILPWLEDIPQVSRRRTRQIRLERNAIEVLQRMGPVASPSVLTLLSDTRYGGRDTGIAILRAYGTNVFPFLVAAVEHAQPSLRAGAVITLGKFPSDQLGSLTPFRNASQDSEPAVRSAAVWALGQMQDRPGEVIPDLVSALADPSPQVQSQAASALRSFAAAAAPAVPALRLCLAASSDPVRTEAALTLGAIGGTEARTAATELLNAMRQRESASARHAACTLLALDLHPKEAVDRLQKFLNHRDSNVRSRTLDAMRGLGPRGTPLVPTILSLLENDDERDNRAALTALRNIQPDAIPERFRQGRRRTASTP